MYPAVCMEDLGSPKEIFYEQAIGAGRHEVLVDTPIHGETIDMFPKERLLCILQVLRMIRTGACGCFNPWLLECFFGVEEQLSRMYRKETL